MPPDLEIKVLFCYSTEVLEFSYDDNLELLKEDNEKLCSITQDILNKNITNYHVLLSVASNLEIDDLQERYTFPHSTLSENDLEDLAECTLSENENSAKFGNLPKDLLGLKDYHNATVLVLQALLSEVSMSKGTVGDSAIIGVKGSRDNTVAIGRTKSMNNIMTSQYSKTMLAHEFGHLMGCYHPYGLGEGFSLDANVDSHGHCVSDPTTGEPLCGTIMSYAKEPILYYSNPNLFEYPAPYQNEPCGVVGISEAYKTVNANIQKLAGIF